MQTVTEVTLVIQSAGVSPLTIETGGAVTVAAKVVQETTTYMYATSPTLGRCSMGTSLRRQIDNSLRKV